MPSVTLDQLFHKHQRPTNPIAYKKMLRNGASTMLEFKSRNAFFRALTELSGAFPNTNFLTDRSTQCLVLNNEEELTYFKLIESSLLEE